MYRNIYVYTYINIHSCMFVAEITLKTADKPYICIETCMYVSLDRYTYCRVYCYTDNNIGCYRDILLYFYEPARIMQKGTLRMRKISILNYKGGVGKTSLAINLSDELRRRGKVVVLVDCDRQRNASSIIPGDTEIDRTLLEVLTGTARLVDAAYEARPGLFIVPSHTDLDKAAKHLTISGTRTLKTLRYGVDALEGVDYVFFDHAPSYSPITDAALIASSEILIPVELESFSIDGLVDMITKLTDQTLPELEHEIVISGYVPSNLDFTKSMTSMYLGSLKKTFGERVMPGVRTDAQISKSQSMRQSVFEYNPHSKGAQDYRAIATTLLEQEVLAYAK